jgi:hypothetical protein
MHGTVERRKQVRQKLLLWFARECFLLPFKDLKQFFSNYVIMDLEFQGSFLVKTKEEAFSFIAKNSASGVISSPELMCELVAKVFKAVVYLSSGQCMRIKTFGNTKKHIENTLYLIHNAQKDAFTLKRVMGLNYVKSRPYYTMIKPGADEIHVCDLFRLDSIHFCSVEQRGLNSIIQKRPHKKKQPPSVWVFLLKKKHLTLVSSSLYGSNPTFFVDSAPSTLFVVQTDDLGYAEVLLKRFINRSYKKK